MSHVYNAGYGSIHRLCLDCGHSQLYHFGANVCLVKGCKCQGMVLRELDANEKKIMQEEKERRKASGEIEVRDEFSEFKEELSRRLDD